MLHTPRSTIFNVALNIVSHYPVTIYIYHLSRCINYCNRGFVCQLNSLINTRTRDCTCALTTRSIARREQRWRYSLNGSETEIVKCVLAASRDNHSKFHFEDISSRELSIKGFYNIKKQSGFPIGFRSTKSWTCVSDRSTRESTTFNKDPWKILLFQSFNTFCLYLSSREPLEN